MSHLTLGRRRRRSRSLNGGRSTGCWSNGCHRFLCLPLTVAGVYEEGPSWRKFPELMTHHVFRNEDRNKLSSVVDADCISDHLRRYCRTARPGLNYPFLPGFRHRRYFLRQMRIDERSFLDRACHRYFAFLPLTIYLSEEWFFLVLYPLVGFPQGVIG